MKTVLHCIATRAALVCGIIAASVPLSSCSIDLFGFVASESTPDSRFAESRSAPQPAGIDPGNDFSFIFVTDLHTRNGSHQYLRALKDRLDGAAFVVIGGDITQNGQECDVAEFIAARDSLGVPVYAVPGNHDVYSSGWARTQKIGPSSSTVKLGTNARLVCLDTANGTLGTSQLEWLQGVLASSGEATIIVATHMQFFTNDFLESQQFTSPEETALLLSLYNRSGVDLLLAGHSHRYDSTMVGSVRYCTGGSFLDGSESSSYLRVRCSGGTVTVSAPISF